MLNKVSIIGGAGAPNYGDELIVKGWINHFKNNYPNTHLTIYENIEKNEVALHGDHNFSDDLVKVAKAYSGIGFWDQVKRGYSFIDNNGIEKYSKFNLQPLLESNIVILHGGGYLNNYDPEKGFYIGFLASLNAKYGVRVYASGIGFGPVSKDGLSKDDISFIDEVFSKFESFELRDVDNFRYLSKTFRSANFIYGIDDSYLIPIKDLVEVDESKRRMYLSFLEYNLTKFSNEFWEELINFSKDFDEVYFIESYPWQDRNVYDFLSKKFDSIKLINIQFIMNNKIKISSNDFACCARFHVHYLFARSNVKGIYFQDSKYYDIKHQSIIDKGSMIKECGYGSFKLPTIDHEYSYISMQDEKLHEQKLKYVNNCIGLKV